MKEQDITKKAQDIAEEIAAPDVDKVVNDRIQKEKDTQICSGIISKLGEYGIDDVDITEVKAEEVPNQPPKAPTEKEEQYDWKVGQEMWTGKRGKAEKVEIESIGDQGGFQVFGVIFDDLSRGNCYGWELYESEPEATEAINFPPDDIHGIAHQGSKKIAVGPDEPGSVRINLTVDEVEELQAHNELSTWLKSGRVVLLSGERPNLELWVSEGDAWHVRDELGIQQPEKESSLLVKIQAPKFSGVIKVTNIKKGSFGEIQSFEFDDSEIKKAYDVGKFQVTVPKKGRYLVDAVSEKTAVNLVMNHIYGSDVSPEEKARIVSGENDISVERVDTNVVPEQKQVEPVTVVYQEDTPPVRVQGHAEVIPEWIGQVEKEMGEDLVTQSKEKIDKELINQIAGKIQAELNELEIPIEITEVDLGNCSCKYEGDKEGSFTFDAVVDGDELVEVKASIDTLKAMYGIKEIQVSFGTRVFATEAKDEVTAVKKVLEHLEKEGEDLAIDGKKIASKNISEEALKKIASSNTKVIKVYNLPGEVNLGSWKITTDKDGQKVFEKC